MTGREIRRWAWQRWRENVWFILFAALLAELPSLLVKGQIRFDILNIPALLYGEVYLGNVLLLGFTLTILTLIREGNMDLGCLVVPFRNKKAFLLALVFTVYDVCQAFLQVYIPDLYLLLLLVGFLLNGLFFTIEYDLFLFPGRTLKELFRESAAVGERNFGEIVVFNLVLGLMLGAGNAILGMAAAFLPIAAILVVVFTIAYQPFAILAQARMAMEVSGVGDQAR